MVGSFSSRVRSRLDSALKGLGTKRPIVEVKYGQAYSSTHIVMFRRLVHDGEEIRVPIEVQVRTTFEDAWAQVDHKLRYASKRIKQSSVSNTSVAHERHPITLKKLLDVASEYCETIFDEVNSKDRPSTETIRPIDGRDSFSSLARSLRLPSDVAEQIDGLLLKKDEIDLPSEKRFQNG